MANKKRNKANSTATEKAPATSWKTTVDKYAPYVYGAILLLTFFNIYSKVFDEKVDLNGDNVSYYILGQSIATGQGYSNIFSNQQAHNHFPPGYPAIIGVVSKLFSNDINFIKEVNGFFLLLSIGLVFLIVYQLVKNYHVAFIVALFSLLNYHLLRYSVIMMSEVPFLFFSILTLYLLIKTDFSKALQKNWIFFVLILVLAATYHIRSTGLALFGGIALFLLIKKNWKYAGTLVGGFVLLVLPWYIRSKNLGGNSYMKQLTRKNPYRAELGQMEFSDWLDRIWNNFERYITREIPYGTFNWFDAPDYNAPLSSGDWFLGLLILGIMLFGLFRIKKYMLLLLFYLGASFAILMIWPDVWFGVRFLVPLVPILFFLFINGILEMVKLIATNALKLKQTDTIALITPLVFLLFIGSFLAPLDQLKAMAKAPYQQNYQNYFQLGRWVKINGAPNAITACRKGQLFYLYSNTPTTRYKDTQNAEELIQDLIDKNTTYVVIDQLGYSSTARYLVPAVQKYPTKFKMVQHLKNPDTYLMEFHPELGYVGEFKENMHHGKGTFVFPNGQKYVGEWKNNLRNGIGKLYLTNGQYMEGNWTNDQMNGTFITYNENGEQIEQAEYVNNQKVNSF